MSRISLERAFIALGVLCVAYYGLCVAHAAAFQRAERAALERGLAQAQPSAETGGLVGMLDVPRLNMSVMVMDGEDTQTLLHAAGHLQGTAFPWESGNAAIAGHRDTYFRPLRNVRVGDRIRLTTTRGVFDYRVRDTRVVRPDDLSVSAPTSQPTLTLVTCYPFSFLGSAPERFVVRADRDEDYNRERPGGVHAQAFISFPSDSRGRRNLDGSRIR